MTTSAVDEHTPDDDLGARIGAALHRRADPTDVPVPAVAQVRSAVRRHDRNRRLRLGAVVAAAAVVVAVVLVPRGNDDAAYYEVGPGPDGEAAVPEPLHLALDAPGLTRYSAVQSRPTATGEPPGTHGVEPAWTEEVIIYGEPGSLELPRLLLGIRTYSVPLGEDAAPNGSEEQTTIGGRNAIVGNGPTGRFFDLRWDDRHEVTLMYLGVDEAAASAALDSLIQDAGRWVLATPPPGLVEVARATPNEVVPGWYSDVTLYDDVVEQTVPSLGSHRITVTRVDPQVDDDDLLAWALQAGQGPAPPIERTTVRGHAALVVEPGEYPLPAITYAWLEPDHQVVVTVKLDTSDRARADELIASLREVGADEWSQTLATCVETNGTVGITYEGRTGGSCPR